MVRTVTAHQRRIIAAVIVTGSYKEAGAQLGISENAVRNGIVRMKLTIGGDLTTLQLAYLLGYRAGLGDRSSVESYRLPISV